MTENEQPYKIPNDWHWAMVGDVAALHRGVSFTKDDVHKAKQADDILIIRGGNVKEGYIDLETDNVYVSKNLVSETQIIKKNDIVVVASTASVNVIGRAGIADRDYSDVACGGFLMLVRPSENVIPSYVDYFFQSDFYRKRIRNLAAGTNINNIRNKHILDTPIPLPSLDEQQRIAGRIESLFAKLNRVEEKLSNIMGYNDLKNTTMGKIYLMRKTILARAFRGKLGN